MSRKAWIASLVNAVIFAHTGPANCLLAQTRTVSSIQVLLNPPMVTLSEGKEPVHFHWTFQELRNADTLQNWPYMAKKANFNIKNHGEDFLAKSTKSRLAIWSKKKKTSHSPHNTWSCSKIRKSMFRTSKMGVSPPFMQNEARTLLPTHGTRLSSF